MRDPENFYLDNGIEVFAAPYSSLHSLSIAVGVRYGSAYETPDTCGAAHFLEHMLFKGTRTKTAKQLTEAFKMAGINKDYNAETSKEATIFYARAPAQKYTETVSLFADLIGNSTLPRGELDLERGPVISEIRGNRDDPGRVLMDTILSEMFPGKPPGMIGTGDEKVIKTISRQELLSIYKKNYVGSNIVVALCGRLSGKQMKGLASDYFSNIPKGKPSPDAEIESSPIKGRKVDIERQWLNQTEMGFGFRIPGSRYLMSHDSSSYPSIILLSSVLSSRLFEEVREKKGLVYSIGAYEDIYRNFGGMMIGAGSEPKNAEAVQKTVLKEVQRFADGEISKEDVELEKELMKMSRQKGLDNTLSLAKNISFDRTSHKIKPGELRLNDITLDSVRSVAGLYLQSDNALVVTLGPGSKKK